MSIFIKKINKNKITIEGSESKSFSQEKVFSIPELRLYILSYYLEKSKKKKIKRSFYKFIKNRINDKIDNIIYYIVIKLGFIQIIR